MRAQTICNGIMVFALAASGLASSTPSRAQGTNPNKVVDQEAQQDQNQQLKQRTLQGDEQQPPASKVDPAEEAAYKAFFDAGGSAPDTRIQLGTDFLAKYPMSRYAESVYAAIVQAYYAKQDWKGFYAEADKGLAAFPDDVTMLSIVGWVIPHVFDPERGRCLGKSRQGRKIREARDRRHRCDVQAPRPDRRPVRSVQIARARRGSQRPRPRLFSQAAVGRIGYRAATGDAVYPHSRPHRFLCNGNRFGPPEPLSRGRRRLHEMLPNRRWAPRSLQTGRGQSQTAGLAAEVALKGKRVMTADELAGLETLLGHRFEQPERLERALTHRSHRQNAGGVDNERLEFLGDRVLGLVASEHLFRCFRDWDAGKLSKGLARLVSASSIYAAAQRLEARRSSAPWTRRRKNRRPRKKAAARRCLRSHRRRDLSRRRFAAAAAFLAPHSARSRACGRVSKVSSAPITNPRCRNGCSSAGLGMRRIPQSTSESGPDHQKIFEVEVWHAGTQAFLLRRPQQERSRASRGASWRWNLWN